VYFPCSPLVLLFRVYYYLFCGVLEGGGEGIMMAVAVIASIPIFILFFSLSKYFVGGSSVYSAGKE